MTTESCPEILNLMAKKNSKQTSFRRKWLIIVVTFFVLFAIFYAALPKQTIAPSQTTNNSSAETAGWKTYVDSENVFSIKYPPNWTASTSESGSISNNPKNGKKDLTLKGSEGNVLILQIDTYGGGCDPSKHKSMMLGNLEIADGCQGIDSERNKEIWNAQKELDLRTHLGILVNAEADKPIERNRIIILEILSTLKVTK